MFQSRTEILSGASPGNELSALQRAESVQRPMLLESEFSFVEETNCSCSGIKVQPEMVKQSNMLSRIDLKVLTGFVLAVCRVMPTNLDCG